MPLEDQLVTVNRRIAEIEAELADMDTREITLNRYHAQLTAFREELRRQLAGQREPVLAAS